MLVEFAGCSGTGKSVLHGRVGARLRRQPIPVASPLELFCHHGLAQTIESTRCANLVLELATYRYLRPALDEFESCWLHARQLICSHGQSGLERWRLIRSLRRKLCVAYVSQLMAADTLVLVDEGCVQLTHILFGRAAEWDSSELDQFVAELPKPDLIIHVTASSQVSERRIKERGRPPLPDRCDSKRRKFIAGSHAIFQRVFENANLSSRRLMIDNSRTGVNASESIAARLSEQVLTAFQNQDEKPVYASGSASPPTDERRDSSQLAIGCSRFAHPA